MTRVYVVALPDPKSGEPRHFGFWSREEAADFAAAKDHPDAAVMVVVMPYDNN